MKGDQVCTSSHGRCPTLFCRSDQRCCNDRSAVVHILVGLGKLSAKPTLPRILRLADGQSLSHRGAARVDTYFRRYHRVTPGQLEAVESSVYSSES